MRNPCSICSRDYGDVPYSKVNGFPTCSKPCDEKAKDMFKGSPDLNMGKVMAAVAKRFNYHREQRRILSMNEGAQHIARWICEEILLRDLPPRVLIINEGQDATIALRNKDGTITDFRIEAGSHRLWIMER